MDGGIPRSSLGRNGLRNVEDFPRFGGRRETEARGRNSLGRETQGRGAKRRQIDWAPLHAASTKRTGCVAPNGRCCLIGLAAVGNGDQGQDGMLADQEESEENQK
jgi:hypothetical protein